LQGSGLRIEDREKSLNLEAGKRQGSKLRGEKNSCTMTGKADNKDYRARMNEVRA